MLERKLRTAGDELAAARAGQEGAADLHKQVASLKELVEKKDGNIARSEKARALRRAPVSALRCTG